jgi:hypothetical protein
VVFSLKTDVNVEISRGFGGNKNIFFVAILQVTEEKCRILVWIRIKTSWIQNTVRNECKGVIWDPDPDKEELDPESDSDPGSQHCLKRALQSLTGRVGAKQGGAHHLFTN